MKKSISELLEERKVEVKFRTDRTQAEFGRPPLSASPVVYEVAEKTRVVTDWPEQFRIICDPTIEQLQG